MVLGIPVEQFFLETAGLYALLILLPLIILYLIKPKPKEKKIPSLMFFMKDLGSAKNTSFFRRFTKDLLFLLQLIILFILALSVAKPFLMVSEAALAENTVIVLDMSASMQANYEGSTRFKKAKNLALDNLGSVNTIILAKNVPLVGKIEVDEAEARAFIKDLKASSTSSAIYDSIRAAIDYSGEGTRIVAISDFMETEVDSDVNTVKKALMARGAIVEYLEVASSVGNIGIVDLVVGEEATSVQVRNYYPDTRDVTLKVGNVVETLTLKSGEADVVTFSTPKGVNTVELDIKDDFELDNKAYISTPEDTELDVLFITNDENIESTNMWVAFQAIDQQTNYGLTIEKAVPPKSIKIDHDLVILKDFDQNKILPGVFRDLAKQAKSSGTTAIITPQPGMFSYAPLAEILPVNFVSENKEGSEIQKAKPEIESLTKDVNFGSVGYYFNTVPKKGTRSIAVGRDNGTIIALGGNNGKMLYYGIFDQDILIEGKSKISTFKHDLFYPIFWKRVLDILTDTPSVDSLNQRAGRIVQLANNEKVKTPSGNVVEGVFMLENQGIYNFKNRKIATNLLNSKESDVSGTFSEIKYENQDLVEVEREKPKPLTQEFILAGLILLLLELFYVKLRGDM